MDVHAFNILEDAELWDWHETRRVQENGNKGGRYKIPTARLLFCLSKESKALGGTVLEQFWDQLRKCHPRLRENIRKLQVTPTPPEQTSAVIFAEIDRKDVDLTPLFEMAAEYFSHLCVAVMNPGEEKSEGGTPPSVGDIASMETDQLLAELEHGLERRRQALTLKCLVMKRDGLQCPVTGVEFRKPLSSDSNGFVSFLTHVIPRSVQGKPDTRKCLAMFAGEQAASNLVLEHLDSVRNSINLEANAHRCYDEMEWGIEACEEGEKVKYKCRGVIPRSYDGPVAFRLPLPIILRDGDDIHFGRGPDGERLDGPLPLLCNIQLAMARVLRMSGVARIILQIKEDADDSEFPHVYIASDDFCDILTAKLLLVNGIPA